MWLQIWIVIFCLIVDSFGIVYSATLRYCVPDTVLNSRALHRACDSFNKEKHYIQCVKAEDRLECFKMLMEGRADFMVAEPDDLRLMKKFGASDVIITHQLQKYSNSRSREDVEMIVLVKKDDSSNENYTTKGKKLCYLGLENHESVKHNYYYTTFFESWLFPNLCDSDKHLLENRIASLSSYFNSACIAGPWSLDRSIDTELKHKYKNLCSLCSNPVTCSQHDRFYGMNGALACLKSGAGDLAWLNRASLISQLPKLINENNYYLLCPDGNLVSLAKTDYKNTCTWISDSRAVVLSKKSVGDIVRNKMRETDKEDSNKFFKIIRSTYKFFQLKKLDKIESITSYLDKFPDYLAGTSRSPSSCPQRSFNWCVVTRSEANKCRALKQAADVMLVRPVFNCIVMENRTEGIRAVIDGRCDVFLARPEEIIAARRSGANALLDLLANDRDDSNGVAAIVKDRSHYHTFADLKGAKACFTGYKSVGWNAFLSVLKNQSFNMDCTDIKTVANYFKESCVLGLDVKDKNTPKKLYSLCNNTDLKFGPDEKTIQCLMDGADVAFVNVTAAKVYTLHKNKIFSREYRLLHPDGKLDHSFSYIGKSTLGSIIVHANMTEVRKNDIYLAFLKLDNHFGRIFNQETPMFEMYKSFEGEDNVLFPNTTMKLERATPGSYGENLNFSNDPLCVSKGNNIHFQKNSFIIYTLIIFNLYYLH